MIIPNEVKPGQRWIHSGTTSSGPVLVEVVSAYLPSYFYCKTLQVYPTTNSFEQVGAIKSWGFSNVYAMFWTYLEGQDATID